jgi:hypothetical protein
MVFGSLDGRALASIETNAPSEGVVSKLPLSGSDETRTQRSTRQVIRRCAVALGGHLTSRCDLLH